MRSQIFEKKNLNLALNASWKKKLFLKLFKITFKFFFFFIQDHISKTVLSQDFFYLFCA